MVRVGIVGFGFMGRMHYRCWAGLPNAEVTAICDANEKVLEELDKSVGNIEGLPENIDLSKVKFYGDIEKMLAEEELDAVSIALPTHLHADFSTKALEAGVNVLCEKPMALSVEDCDLMIEAARTSGKELMVGHCIRFWPEYVKTKEIIDSGKYGKVVAATFRRIGSPPAWSNWFADDSQSGGMITDLHIHDSDYVQYVFGMPKAVVSHQATNDAGKVVHVVTQYEYNDGKLISAEGGWGMAETFGFEMSFNIMLEKATIVYDCTRQPAFKLCCNDGEVIEPEIEEGDGYSREVEYFVKLIQGKNTEEVITLEQSKDSIRLVEAEKESASTGEKIVL